MFLTRSDRIEQIRFPELYPFEKFWIHHHHVPLVLTTAEIIFNNSLLFLQLMVFIWVLFAFIELLLTRFETYLSVPGIEKQDINIRK